MSAPGTVGPTVVNWRIGLVALVITAAIIGVVLWATIGHPGAGSPGNTPTGPASTALGVPVPGGGASNHSYAMAIVPGSGLTWGQVTFAIEVPTGQEVPPNPSWTVVVANTSSGPTQPLASYGFQTGTWATGAHVLATSAQTIYLELGSTNLKNQGYTFTMIINPSSGSSQGERINASLP